MKEYMVTLSRSYAVSINAEDAQNARELAEFFIGDPKDESNEQDRKQHNFSIDRIEMTYNEALDVEDAEETENSPRVNSAPGGDEQV